MIVHMVQTYDEEADAVMPDGRCFIHLAHIFKDDSQSGVNEFKACVNPQQ